MVITMKPPDRIFAAVMSLWLERMLFAPFWHGLQPPDVIAKVLGMDSSEQLGLVTLIRRGWVGG